MTNEQRQIKLKQLIELENEINKEISIADKKIQKLEKEKKKLRKRVSHNMKFRNNLINEFYQEKHPTKK